MASTRTTERSHDWLGEQSATTLARSRIYGEGLVIVTARPTPVPALRRNRQSTS